MKLPPAQTHEIYVNFGVRLVWPLLHVHICRIINSFLFGISSSLWIFLCWLWTCESRPIPKLVSRRSWNRRRMSKGPSARLPNSLWRARRGPKRAELNYAETAIRGPAHNHRDGMSRNRERRERVQIEINDSLLAFVLLGVRDDTSCARTTRKINELKIVGHYFSVPFVLMTSLSLRCWLRVFSFIIPFMYITVCFLSSPSVERIKPSQQAIYVTHRYAKLVFVKFRT